MSPALRVSLQRGVALVIGMLVAAAIPAQVNDDANGGVQFSFGTPGARSLAMGGAFLGLADDPSAAYTNPAGLTALEGSHADVEFREVKFTHLFTTKGHYAGRPSFYGEDNVEGLVFGKASNNDQYLSSLSYAYGGDGWALSAFRYLPGTMTAEYRTVGPWVGDYSFDPDLSTIDRRHPAAVGLQLEAIATGVAVAFDLGQSLTVGLAASYWQVELDSITQNLFFNPDSSPPPAGSDPQAPAFYAPPANFGDGGVFTYQYQEVDDDDISFNLGVLWRATDRIWFGATYRQGTEYDLTFERTCGGATPPPGEPICEPAADSGTFAVPTMYGIGISLRPLEGLTLTMDVNRVEYSEMTDDVAGPPEYASENQSFTVENGTELRFGVEYAFSNLRTPIYVRGGLWLDPAHQMGYRGSINDPIFLALWEAERETEDEGHLTAGVGWLIANRFTIDLGFDVSDRIDTVSAAAGYRF